jgi:hypothetical protein
MAEERRQFPERFQQRSHPGTTPDVREGNHVFVRARVLRARLDPKVDPAYHIVDLQLPDGQFLQTHVSNLYVPEAKAIESAPENKAIESAPSNKARKR